jgi:hypothetical protein
VSDYVMTVPRQRVGHPKNSGSITGRCKRFIFPPKASGPALGPT